jgi:hypothetical protein
MVVAYAPTETKSSQADIERFYHELGNAVTSVTINSKPRPIVAGDFNVKVGCEATDELVNRNVTQGSIDDIRVTGEWANKRVSSRNCSYLFDFCHHYNYVIGNTYFLEENSLSSEWATWYHPGTNTPHMKDLILIPRESLECFCLIRPDQSFVAGSNDHSLVVGTLRRVLPEPQLQTQQLERNQGHRRQPNARGNRRAPVPNPPRRQGGGDFEPRNNPRNATRAAPLKDLDWGLLSSDRELQERILSSFEDISRLAPPGWQVTSANLQMVADIVPQKRRVQIPKSWRDMSEQGNYVRLLKVAGACRIRAIQNPDSVLAKASYMEAKACLRTEIQTCKQRQEDALVNLALTGGRVTAKKAALLLSGDRTRPCTVKVAVTPAGFSDHFRRLFGKRSPNSTLNLTSNTGEFGLRSEGHGNHSGPPTEHEISKAIDRLGSGKAPGADSLPPDLFKALKVPLASRMVSDFAAIWPTQRVAGQAVFPDLHSQGIFQSWQDATVVTLFKKGDASDPNNYRGIFLLEVAGKILTSVISARIATLIEPWLSDEQCGFRKRRGTLHQILQVRRMQEEVERAKMPAAICFVDFKKAFDSPPREAIYEVLDWIGCPGDLLAVIMGIHEKPMGHIIGCDATFEVLRGVRQGCTLGPILFTLLLEFSLRKAKLQPNDIELICTDRAGLKCPPDIAGQTFNNSKGAYADDIYLIGTCQMLSEALSRIQAVCGDIGLDISVTKTEWMWLWAPESVRCGEEPDRLAGNAAATCCSQVTLNGQVVKHVRQFSYLGSSITEQAGGGSSGEITRRISSAVSKLRSLNYIWKSSHLLRRKKVRLLKALVFPVLTYGHETWSMRAADYEAIEVFLNKARLSIIGRSRWLANVTLSNHDLHRMCRLPSAAQLVVPSRIRFVVENIARPACNAARRMIFAQVKTSGSILHRQNSLPQAIRADLRFLLDGLRVDFLSELQIKNRFNKPPPAAGHGHSWLLDLLVAVRVSSKADNSRRVRQIIQLIFAESQNQARQEKPAREKTFPRLRSAPDPVVRCPQCNAAYSENKALSRHIKHAHGWANATSHSEDRERTEVTTDLLERKSVKHVEFESSNRVETVPSLPARVLRSSERGALTEPQPPDKEAREATKVPREASIKFLKPPVEGDPRPWQCHLCAMTYVTVGWYRRHYLDKHGMDIGNLKKQEHTVMVRPPKPVNPAAKYSCSVCGKGDNWKSFKTLQNHMSSFHQINALTGEKSRERQRKATNGGAKL